jgi:hypothetical protein
MDMIRSAISLARTAPAECGVIAAAGAVLGLLLGVVAVL